MSEILIFNSSQQTTQNQGVRYKHDNDEFKCFERETFGNLIDIDQKTYPHFLNRYVTLDD